jgi:competence protein ComEC
MYILSLGFLAGTMGIILFPTLPPLSILSLNLFIIPLLWIFWKNVSIRLIGTIYLGFSLALFTAHNIIDARLSPQLEGKILYLTGIVSSVPQVKPASLSFYFTVEHSAFTEYAKDSLPFVGKTKLTWYRSLPTEFASGERWQIAVKLKRPYGFSNTGGFDYERWLLHNRVLATGYVRPSRYNQRLLAAPTFQLNLLREKIYQAIQEQVSNSDIAALISALSVAIRTDISTEYWEVFRKTGTSHLMAISGLHIAMVAGFAILPISLVWILFPALYLRVPIKIATLTLGAVFATAYALLAGFTIPTQRALFMVLCALVALSLKYKFSVGHFLAVAVIGVLVIDPLAALSEGFWLSFFAVALIFYMAGQSYKAAPYQLLHMQLLLSLGMIPISAAFFSSASLISPLANIIAIPWVTLLVAPSILLGVLLLFIAPVLSQYCFMVATWTLEVLLDYLRFLSQLPHSVLNFAELPPLLIIIAIIGVLIIALPQGLIGRYLGIIFLAPLFFYTPKKLPEGNFKLTLLDVGQGLASVLQTRNHVLVFDTGEHYSKQFDMGKMVLLPYLQSQQIYSIDKLIISHLDKDHAGGASAVLKQLPTVQFVSNDQVMIAKRHAMLCQAGQQWVWDKVQFRVLSPNTELNHLSKNDRSCVIQVSNGYHSALLLADIEKATEQHLVRDENIQLASEVMLVPHHGSKTSSSWSFLGAVKPQLALLSTGYRNRFNHPHAKIMSRYQQLNIPVLNTVDYGEIQLHFPNNHDKMTYIAKRKVHKRFWTDTH